MNFIVALVGYANIHKFNFQMPLHFKIKYKKANLRGINTFKSKHDTKGKQHPIFHYTDFVRLLPD